MDLPHIRGRGARENPAGRFEKLESTTDAENFFTEDAGSGGQVKTEFFNDSAKSILSTNDSPDLGMDTTLNPYRGCEHGCIYCYARPTHEYYGLSAGLDFETKIFVKPEAPRLLEEKLSASNWNPRVITLSGVTDCYQPIERKLEITRQCLIVLKDFRNPVAIITKNNLVTRDSDIYAEMAAFNAAAVFLSITTLDNQLSYNMEPRASSPVQRLRAVEELAKAGVPVGINIGPVIPGLTEHEIPAIMKAAADAGAKNAHYTMVRLPYGVKDIFQRWLEDKYPDRKEKVLNHIRSMRDGKLNDAGFGSRMVGNGIYADHIADMVELYRKKYGLNKVFHLSSSQFRKDARSRQMSLW